MTDRELILGEIETFDEKQLKVFKFLLELVNGYSNKGDIMKFADTYNGVDSAIPQPWAGKMRDYGINPTWYAWSYQENHVFGEPVHLLEKLYDKMIKTFKEGGANE